VGEALGDPAGTAVTGAACDDVEAEAGVGSFPSHAASDPANTQTDIEIRNLRKRSTPERSGTTRGYP
jgi:hypothetical protein